MDWRTLARCRNQTSRFFPETADQKIVAKALCKVCPVQRSCLAEALMNHEDQGVWGGKDEKERRIMFTILDNSGFRMDLPHDVTTLTAHG